MHNQEIEIIHYNRKNEKMNILSPDNLRQLEDAIRQIVLKELGD